MNKFGINLPDLLDIGLSKSDIKRKEDNFKKLKSYYKDYSDPWGFNLETIKKTIDLTLPIYRKYFKVRVFGLENIQDEPYMIVSNHTGQIPIDGMLITLAFAFELENPRIIHSMIERFMAGLPFIGDIAAQTGSILGDRENCKWLLNKGESILVFPEGVRGINKSTKHFYELQKFSNGFYRIAVQSKVKILPISVIGAEEMFPVVFQGGDIGKNFGMPSLPIPLNTFPLPSPIDIYIGKPIEVSDDVNAESMDSEIRKHVYKIENIIKKNINIGLEQRREFMDWLRSPLNKIVKKL